jgi:hypothetical protein
MRHLLRFYYIPSFKNTEGRNETFTKVLLYLHSRIPKDGMRHLLKFYYIRVNPNKMHTLQSLSDNCSTCFGRHYHPSSEAQTIVTTASGTRYTVLLSAAIAEDLELIWLCCGWRTPPTTHSNQFQIFRDSSRQQYGVTGTRCCSYNCLCSWRWVIVTPETCRAVVR